MTQLSASAHLFFGDANVAHPLRCVRSSFLQRCQCCPSSKMRPLIFSSEMLLLQHGTCFWHKQHILSTSCATHRKLSWLHTHVNTLSTSRATHRKLSWLQAQVHSLSTSCATHVSYTHMLTWFSWHETNSVVYRAQQACESSENSSPL